MHHGNDAHDDHFNRYERTMDMSKDKKRKRLGVGGLEAPSIESENKRSSNQKLRVVFVLEHAQLETAKLGSKICLLSADAHKGYLAKHGKDITTYRPDILHHSLLTILDAPLCKLGYVEAIYIHTMSNVLIRVDSSTKLPRTYDRFAGLVTQLLQKFSIRAEKGTGKLFRCVKGPITRHLPSDACVVALSREAEIQKRARHLVDEFEDGRPIVFVVGAIAHGHLNVDYAERNVSITDLPLSAACCLSKLSNALEEKWKIA